MQPANGGRDGKHKLLLALLVGAVTFCASGWYTTRRDQAECQASMELYRIVLVEFNERLKTARQMLTFVSTMEGGDPVPERLVQDAAAYVNHATMENEAPGLAGN